MSLRMRMRNQMNLMSYRMRNPNRRMRNLIRRMRSPIRPMSHRMRLHHRMIRRLGRPGYRMTWRLRRRMMERRRFAWTWTSLEVGSGLG